MAQYNACHSSMVQQHATWHVGHRPRQHGGIKNPPGNDTIQRQAALQALATRQLAFFNTTPTFQNPVPDFNTPPARVPLLPAGSRRRPCPRHGGQQQPLNGRDVLWRLDFLDVHGPQGHHGQAFTPGDGGEDTASRDKTAVPMSRPVPPAGHDAAPSTGGGRPPGCAATVAHT